jgi:muconolactone delta-isomerase
VISVQFSGLDTVIENLASYEADQINRVRLACIEIAHVLEQYAITHHEWRVRTQATNLTTRGTFDQPTEDLFEVVLSAGMEYNKYLELAGPQPGGFAAHLAGLPHESLVDYSSGKYAWLWPAIMANADQILSIIQRHLRH